MSPSSARALDNPGAEPGGQPHAPTPQTRLPDVVGSVDWADLLTALESDFLRAIANGEARYLHARGDLMGRVVDE